MRNHRALRHVAAFCCALALLFALCSPAGRAEGSLPGPFRDALSAAEALAENKRAIADARLEALPAQNKAGPLYRNLSSTDYRHQLWHTCKATALATAVNLLRGNNDTTTTAMGGLEAINISWLTFTGSDGVVYRGVYKFDEDKVPASEFYDALERALNAGIPFVASIHSTIEGRSQHHWVNVVGRAGSDYLIVDPAWGEEGSVAENAVPLSALHYSFGLNDAPCRRFCYMTFTPEPAETEAGQ